MKAASEISSSRNQSKDRIQHQLAQMNERLGAIDEVSQSMQRDFNNTKLVRFFSLHSLFVIPNQYLVELRMCF